MKSATGITPIERAFYEIVKTDKELQEYFFTYYSQKLILQNHFYPHVGEKLLGFSDHGPNHINRILLLYSKLLKNNILGLSDSQDVVCSIELNYYEIYLLLCATVWHDVGNLLGRDKHNMKIIDVSNRLENNFFVNKDVKKYAMQIAKAHTGKDAIRKEILIEDIDYKNQEINLRFLGGILRLADELDEGDVRVDNMYYEPMKDQIADENKIFWEVCNCIKRITPKPDESLIEIHAIINQKEELYKIFNKLYTDKNTLKTVALIDELVLRIDKMNHERGYYMEFVRKHADYREIVFELIIESPAPEKFMFKFDQNQGYAEFWKMNPQLNPENKINDYHLQKGGENDI
ncbi:MAG: hypothetical protein OIN86_16670 [Candidatus Methanoperedens sp.]|nr:hypothetical protein [Candidatus Methanoperedens sp.]CAG1003525.1 hypothetical protein METP1_03081 [Methanosarcinales archaeon]